MYFFLKMLLNSFDQDESSRQRGNRKVLESATFEIRKSIMAKTIDMWNVNKLTAAQTKMEVGKLRTRVAQ